MTDQDQNDQVDPEAVETQQPEAEQADGAVDVDISSLQSQLQDLTAALANAKEQTLRAHAETQNARRRAEADVEKAHKFGQEKIVSDLLPVVDNLERALASIDTEDENFKAVVEGVELTLKSFIDTLIKHQVEPVNPVGEPFDPQLHQAMSMIDNPDAEPNTVLEVFQKGYTLHGRLIRPAMVVVAKG
ncbi:nucleotide exchange factor GrpE [Gilvimarinus sp. 1_MG-2023]|uniref:nucleotide exchange factor GrpE n=1 Tax=Gilvimarinus sp. 2_MG-2023 TaxID=3062666 RepID=UPI0026E45AD9|nr:MULTISPECIES: nucleotide exchange factor GrpE [unclassified Gilvimarinus]MDO6569624.1 nucleotide exchange factor GrpE [Gilvimarinus sp. 2_MG-2023]MDO6748583.1 nucleotide exchange factor GrpE [Gilvimarinus sp. 1_MG-2023]